MLTSMIFFSLVVLLPLQVLHFLLAGITLPWPSQSSQAPCICWIMPGPICRVVILIPRPWHPVQSLTSPPPCPSQFSQMTSIEAASFLVFPLYNSSRHHVEDVHRGAEASATSPTT